MYIDGHKFTLPEKTHFAGFVFFMDNVEDRDYPHISPCGQVDEFFSNKISEDFIDSIFAFNISDYVRDYNDFLKGSES
jgi:hypothetical protein